MDLTNLRDSLDSSSRERHPALASAKKSELRLTRDFKSAALQLTTLYRTSLSSSKRSYAAGYTQSLTDILDVVSLRLQQPAHTAPGSRMSPRAGRSADGESDREELRWLIRYLRARIEAIKAESEEEDKDESDDEEAVDEPVHAPHSAPSTSTRARRANRGAPPQASATANDVQMPPEEASNTSVGPLASNNAQSKVAPVFTFSAPVPQTTNVHMNPSKARRQRSAHGINVVAGRAHSPTSLLATAPSSPASANASAHASPSGNVAHFTRASSASSEEDPTHTANSVRPSTPSRNRASARPGKRLTGREKLSGLELFARAHQAKRRRGMGDRREEDFRDDGLM